MATLIKTDGEQVEISPSNEIFSLDEFYFLLDCSSVQIINLYNGKVMWIDENGKNKSHQINFTATELLAKSGGIPGDYIAGSALITDTSEIN